MPQRTNDFQTLFTRIQRALAPAGAQVTESAMVEAADGEYREIDVLMTDSKAKIAVEVKGEGRPMDLIKFESIVGKYHPRCGPAVDKIVIVTHRGYTRRVIGNAKTLGIKLLTLRQVDQFDWSKFFANIPLFKSHFEIEEVEIKPQLGEHDVVARDGKIVCSCGANHGNPRKVATDILREQLLRKNADILAVDERVAKTGEQEGISIKSGLDVVGHERYLAFENQRVRAEEISFNVLFKKGESVNNPIKRDEFCCKIRICKVSYVPPIEGISSSEMRTARISCSCCKKDYGLLETWIHKCWSEIVKPENGIPRRVHEELSKSNQKVVHGNLKYPMGPTTIIQVNDKEFPLLEVTLRIHGERGKPMEAKQFELKDLDGETKTLTEFEMTVGNETLSLLMPDGLQSKHINLQLKQSKASPEIGKS